MIFKRLFCRHFFVFDKNIYGDAIIHSQGNRSQWKCLKCEAIGFRSEFQKSSSPDWYDVPADFKEGRRVKINDKSTFSRGHTGVIRFIEPRGAVWVRRDRSGSDMCFSPIELDLIDTQPQDDPDLADLVKDLFRE